jgi:hypothetical protein
VGFPLYFRASVRGMCYRLRGPLPPITVGSQALHSTLHITSEEFETRRELVGGGARGGTCPKTARHTQHPQVCTGSELVGGGGRARFDRHNFLSFCFLATLRDPPGRSVGPHLRLVARSATQKDCWVLATVSKFSAQLFYRCYTRRCYLAGNEIQLKKAVKERRGC